MAFGVVMLHFEVEETNPWGILFWKFCLKSQFLFFSDIPAFVDVVKGNLNNNKQVIVMM
jgi:hypothetical protein